MKRAAAKKQRRPASAAVLAPEPAAAAFPLPALLTALAVVLALAAGAVFNWHCSQKVTALGLTRLGPYTLALPPEGQSLDQAWALARKAGFEPLGEAVLGEGPGRAQGLVLTGVGALAPRLQEQGLRLNVLVHPGWRPLRYPKVDPAWLAWLAPDPEPVDPGPGSALVLRLKDATLAGRIN